MKAWRVLRIIFALTLLFALTGFSSADVSTPQIQSGSELVCSLPKGKLGISYKGNGRNESLVWGPSALAVDLDGTFWISDNGANRIIHLTTKCKLLHKVPLTGKASAVIDLEITPNGIYILDSSPDQPKVLLMDRGGQILETMLVPTDLHAGMSGLAWDEAQGILIEEEGGAWIYPMAAVSSQAEGQGFVPELLKQRVSLTQSQEADDLPEDDALSNTRFQINLEGKSLPIHESEHLRGVRFIQNAVDGSSLVLNEAVAVVDGRIQVDQTIQKYSPDGFLTETGRVPLKDNYTFVSNGVASTNDGTVYALITKSKGAQIRRISFSPTLEPILPESEAEVDEDSAVVASAVSVSPQTMISNARAYINNSRYLTAANITGTCTGRTKPRYLGAAGTYSSVPYDWGGFDTIAGFNNYMGTSGYRAGDINTASSESCSRGVDCSGYVSRVWNQTTKYSTRSLPSISYALSSTGKLWRGDILNRYDSHVVLFASYAVNGVYTYESTTYNSYDRVVYMFSSWSRLSGYSPRRYTGVSGDSCSGQYLAEYYNNRTLSGNPAMTRCEGWPINFDWGGGSPGSGVNSDNFSARWVGRANFAAGNTTFIITADDGVRVWLDGTLILDKWIDQGPTEYRVTRNVTAGEHTVQIDYYENGGGAVARFRWETNSGTTTSGNLAGGRQSYATSYQGSGYEAFRGNDNSNSTRWSSRISSTLGDEWWWVDLGGQAYTHVTINWERAYAAQYFVGWSNDAQTFYGYWQNISAPGSYTYNLGSHSERYVGILMRTRAPTMGNYSFWETQVVRVSSSNATVDAAAMDGEIVEEVRLE